MGKRARVSKVSPGLAALSGFERAGLIRRVVPLSRPAEQRAPMGVMGAMASPHVAGAAALLLATRGRMSPADVRDRLMSTTDKVGAMHGSDFDPDYGAGRLNLASALSP